MEATQVKKHKILVVDDNSENIRIIGSVLRQNNYNVGFATRGQQALDVLNGNEDDYDLVLLDVNMPEMNGFEVCRIIREKDKFNDLPVIFLTANTLPEQIVEGFTSGGQDYVTKPFHSGELLARIKTHLELKESRSQLRLMNDILEIKVDERTRELKESNLKLEAANIELQKLDDAKAAFLRLISHEINTPLNGIIGFADVLKELLAGTEFFAYIDILAQSAHRLNEFAQTSLIITRMRTSPELYKKDNVDVKEVIEELVVSFHDDLKLKNISVNVNWNTETTEISGNWDLMRICMTHLFRNAVQFTPENKSINIDSYRVDNNLIIKFSDSGPGFSEYSLHNLFKTFATAEDHMDKNKGLGLSIVKLIIDFHQAKILISNNENGGALVTLVFEV